MEIKARSWDVYMSPKYSREVGVAIKGMPVTRAITFLERVVEKKQTVELKRYNKEVPHHFGKPSRYPVKVAKHFLRLIDNAVSNAAYQGADEARLVIDHIEVTRGHPKKTLGAKSLGKVKQRGRRTNILLILGEAAK